MPTNIRAPVALTASGCFTDTTYLQWPSLQENWERGGHEATEQHLVLHGDSNNYLRNMLGTVWYNKNRITGVSRAIPTQYNFRIGTYGSANPGNYSPISSGAYDSQTRGYGRPWYAFKAELDELKGVPIQWQTTVSGAHAQGALRLAGQRVDGDNLTANQIGDATGGTYPIAKGYEQYKMYYKPMRFMVRSDSEMDALLDDVNQTELGRYIVREFRFSSRSLTLPNNYLYWASDLNTTTGALANGAVPIPEGTTKLFPCIHVTMTWLDVPWIAFDNILAAVGTVNAQVSTNHGVNSNAVANPNGNWDYQGAIDAANWPLRTIKGWPPGSLLMDGCPEVIEHTNSAGQFVVDCTMSFVYKPTLWNYFFNFRTNAFAQVVTRDSIGKALANWTYLYPSTNFNSLFVLPIA